MLFGRVPMAGNKVSKALDDRDSNAEGRKWSCRRLMDFERRGETMSQSARVGLMRD